MIYFKGTNRYELSCTGRSFYAGPGGVLGLSNDPEREAYCGFDGTVGEDIDLTPKERREIGHEMIERWARWTWQP